MILALSTSGLVVVVTLAAMLIYSWAGGEAEKRGDTRGVRASQSAVAGGWIVLLLIALIFCWGVWDRVWGGCISSF